MRRFTLFLTVGLLLSQCKGPEDDVFVSTEGLVQNDSLLARCKTPLSGTWTGDANIWYFEELMLKDDGTFTFYDQTCLTKGYTEGRWQEYDGKITLTSYDSYKHVVDKVQPIIVIDKSPAPTQSIKRRRKKEKMSFDTSLYVLDPDGWKLTVKSSVWPADTTKMYFDHELLYIVSNALMSVEENKFLRASRLVRAHSKFTFPLISSLDSLRGSSMRPRM